LPERGCRAQATTQTQRQREQTSKQAMMHSSSPSRRIAGAAIAPSRLLSRAQRRSPDQQTRS